MKYETKKKIRRMAHRTHCEAFNLSVLQEVVEDQEMMVLLDNLKEKCREIEMAIFKRIKKRKQIITPPREPVIPVDSRKVYKP
jgi:hypothetical protein